MHLKKKQKNIESQQVCLYALCWYVTQFIIDISMSQNHSGINAEIATSNTGNKKYQKRSKAKSSKNKK